MNVADVIRKIESNGNQYAQRFERLHWGVSKLSQLARVAKINAVSQATADIYLSMSHGLYQIMGFELYGDVINYDRPVWRFMSDPAEQLRVFNQFLVADKLDKVTVADLKLYKSTRDRFAHFYNGPANIDAYSAKILQAILDLELNGFA